MRCADCRYRDLVVFNEGGEMDSVCRRYPPQIFVIDDDAVQAWPHVDAEDWCGEYAPETP